MGIIAFNSYQYIEKKDGLFVDEICTVKNANEITYSCIGDVLDKFQHYINKLNSKQTTNNDTILGVVIDRSEELAKYYVPVESKGFNYFNVLAKQTIQDSHPPLYHLIFHTVCSITHSDNFMKIGLFVNLVILLLTCLFVQKIALKLTDNEWISFIAMLFYGFSYGYLGNLVFIRMYTLLACLITILLYLFLCLNQRRSIEEGKRYLWLISIVSLLSFLTHYYSILYVLLISIVELYQLKNDGTMRRYFIKYSQITVCLFLLIWPQFFLHFCKGLVFNINKDSVGVVLRFQQSIGLFIRDLFSNSPIPYLLFVVSLLVLLYANHLFQSSKMFFHRFVQSQSSLLIIPSVVYFFIISYISPWVAERYAFPIFPVLSVVVVWILYKTITVFSINKWITSLFVFIFCLFSSSLLGSCTIANMYERTDKKKTFLTYIANKPAIILDSDKTGAYSDIVVNYDHPVYFATNSIHARDFLADKMTEDFYVLYLTHSYKENFVDFFSQLGYTCEELNYSTDFHSVYSLVKSTYE